jgi:hypothetical protein
MIRWPSTCRADALPTELIPHFDNFSFTEISVTYGCHHVKVVIITTWSLPGSNRWPPTCKAGALPTELKPLKKHFNNTKNGRRERD